MRARAIAAAAAALAAAALLPAAAQAGSFGLQAGETAAWAEYRDGTVDVQASSHPYAFSVHFKLRTDGSGHSEGGEMRSFFLDLPPGLIGNPTAVPSCPRQSFEGSLPACSPATQIGYARAIVPSLGEAVGPLYNLAPPPGVAAQFGFSNTELTILAAASVKTDAGYGIRSLATDLPVEATEVTATIWGTPADPSHDPQRGNEGGESSDAAPLPFLTLPASCGAAPELRIGVASKLAPTAYVEETVGMGDAAGHPAALQGCEAVPFDPALAAGPTATAAESPAGLDFGLRLANLGLLNRREGSVVETEPERMEVALPAGIAANPAAAAGQGTCSQADYEAADAADPGCPASSKLGTLTAASPLLEEAIEGSVYLAAPHRNPFGTLIALYVIAAAPVRGVAVKQAVRVDVDPATGRLTATTEGMPPIPFSSFRLRLREGARAPLITPQACGTYLTTARLYPFSDPGTASVREASFEISSGAGGGACASSEAGLANAPTLAAGATAPLAGAYSPFVFKLARADGTQRFARLTAEPPAGLTAKLKGAPPAPGAASAAAAARSGEGEGALELDSPSCPAASRVGTVIAGAGAGPTPYYVTGSAYLAGPYAGAPLSLEIITPAIAGPFDLGTVAVRVALHVDPGTARISAESDPLPQSLHGIPLDLRSVSLVLDREGFTLNPTDCDPSALTGSLTSLAGAVAPLSERFQVGGCRHLPFTPKLALSLKGKTKRTGHPALRAVLTQPAGQAGIARLATALPPSEFIDQAHIGNPCTRPQFAAEKCPPISLLGTATAYSPLLEDPLKGKVYFRANGGERKLPDIVLDLRGQVHLVLVGHVDAIHRKGSEASRIRTVFPVVPDAPVSRFVLALKGGRKHGLLVNSTNLCKAPRRAIVKMRAHSAKTLSARPRIATDCKKKRKKNRHRHRRG